MVLSQRHLQIPAFPQNGYRLRHMIGNIWNTLYILSALDREVSLLSSAW